MCISQQSSEVQTRKTSSETYTSTAVYSMTPQHYHYGYEQLHRLLFAFVNTTKCLLLIGKHFTFGEVLEFILLRGLILCLRTLWIFQRNPTLFFLRCLRWTREPESYRYLLVYYLVLFRIPCFTMSRNVLCSIPDSTLRCKCAFSKYGNFKPSSMYCNLWMMT